MSKLKPTPAGTALHAYVLKPDDKFTPDNPQFKLKLILDRADPGVSEFLATLDAEVEAAFAAETKDLPVAQKKLWKTYLPYEEVLNETTGEPTGRVAVKFKQNARIKRKSGEVAEVKILVQDAKGQRLTNVSVWSGDVVRVGYSVRPSKIAMDKKIGVRLDFLQVRILKKAERDNDVFGGAEEGWSPDDHEDDFTSGHSDVNTPSGGTDSGSAADF